MLTANCAALAAQTWNPICQAFDAGEFPLHQELISGSIRVSVDYFAERAEDKAAYPGSRVKTEGYCKFRVTSASGKTLASGQDEYVMSPQYTDLDGDGVPDLILKTESSGTAGCGAIYVIQVRPARFMGAIQGCEGLQVIDPGLEGLRVFDSKYSDRSVVEAHDSFDLPESNCHTCEPNVPVYFRFENGKLKDVSRDFIAEYDREIDEMRGLIRPQHIKAMLAARTPDEIASLPGFKTASEAELDHEPFDEMAGSMHNYVIRIAFCYVVSGRPEQAWETLDEMWPKWDRQRIKDEILKRIEQSRRDGILKYASQ